MVRKLSCSRLVAVCAAVVGISTLDVAAQVDFFNPATDCVADCSTGQYKENCVGVNSLGYCANCSNAPDGYYYSGQGSPNGNDCPYTACESCGVGEYRSGCAGTSPGSCELCTTSVTGYYYTGDGGLTDNCPIAACSNAPSGSTNLTYFYTDDGTNPDCVTSEACDYATSECSFEVCEEYTECPDGTYLTGCSGNSSGTCLPCTNSYSTVTDDDSTSVTTFDTYFTGPGITEDPESCPLELCAFDCPAGTYREGCSGSSPGWCEPCTLTDSNQYDDAGEYFVTWTTNEGVFCENWNHADHLLGIFNTSDACRDFCDGSAECSVCTFYCLTDHNIQGGTYRALRRCGEEKADVSEGCGSFVDHYGSPVGENACPTATCLADCDIGEYRSGCGGGTSPGTCEPCTNAPALGGSEEYMYVSSGGLENSCAYQLKCPPGKYSNVTISHTNNTDLALDQQCSDCPVGRYSSQSGATTSECEGSCEPGYHCPAGSTSATMESCAPSQSDDTTAANYFCANGFRQTVPPGHFSTPDDSDTFHRTDHDVCAPGSYCESGVQHLCPEGYYGETWGLRTDLCTGECHPSTFCPQGSVIPTRCPPGFYCPSGRELVACPPGTFGASSGLAQPGCDGTCAAGHYCPPASTSATEVECPSGTFGNSTGLTTDSCDGPCPRGYFCPNATSDPRAHPCAELELAETIKNNGEIVIEGDADASDLANGAGAVYCPQGSGAPIRATTGYYTAGGNPRTRSSEIICSTGSYCEDGVKVECPPGTYQSEEGAAVRWGAQFCCDWSWNRDQETQIVCTFNDRFGVRRCVQQERFVRSVQASPPIAHRYVRRAESYRT